MTRTSGGDSRRDLDVDTWARIGDLFEAALERAPEDRGPFLARACAGEPGLADRILRLLAEHERGSGLLDRDLAQLAADIVGQPMSSGLRRIGPYDVLRPLGRGGMGVVYLARHGDLGLVAAIKVLGDASLSPERRGRFLREQRTLAELQHPGIARLYGADVLDDGTPYFVMEFVEGQPLDVHCQRMDLGVRQRLHLFRSVCDAVLFAHGRAVIHRDLKPSNILVTNQGAPKLLDFGIAKHLGPDSSADRTRTGMQLMTPAYAAPEQLVGEPLGLFTDVYALGVILYELLTGCPPFAVDNLTPGQAERLILETEAPKPSARVRASPGPVDPAPDPGAGAPEDRRRRAPRDAGRLSRGEWADLDVLCGTAMHREIGRRYGSVEALARDIDHFLREAPLDARPDSVPYRFTKFARRHARVLTLTAGVVVALAGTVAFYTSRVSAARDVAVAEAARARRIQGFTQSLFTGGDEVAGPSDTLRVLTLVERGVQQADLLESDPTQQAEMFLTLGTILTQMGEFGRADSLLSAALSRRSRAPGSDPIRRAEVLSAVGQLRISEGEYWAADTALSEALRLRESVLPPDDPEVAATQAALGQALEGRGDYDGSIAHLERATATLAAYPGREMEYSGAVSALAATHFYAGNLEASDSLNLKAMEIDRRLHGAFHPSIANGLINLAVADMQRGRYAEAEGRFREAVDIFERYHGPDHPQTASALRLLGQSLLYQDDLARSEPILRRALTLQESALRPDHPRLANTLGDLAYIDLQQGRHEEAVGTYRRIVDIYRAANGERHYFVAVGLSNLADALRQGGRLDESEAMFRDVVERFVESRGADHLDTGIGRIKLGRVLVGQGRMSEAETELLAGYEIVSQQAEPGVSWLRSARTNLIRVYEALDRPTEAARLRAEQAAIDSTSAAGGA